MEKRKTVRQLSKEIGTSASTISRVINHPELVNPKTRERVLNKLEDIGFSITENRRKKANMIIGLTISNPRSVFASTLIGCISDLLSDTNYQLLVFDIKKRQYIQSYFAKHPEYLMKIDGLIISTALVDEKAKEFFDMNQIPLVLLQTRCEGEFSIHNNNFLGCNDAALYMLSRGYKKIAFVSWLPFDEHIRDRYMGFKSALDRKGFPLSDKYHKNCELSSEGGYHATKELMEQTNPPEAIFFGCDDMAAGGYRYLMEHNYSIPNDIGIMGFDNMPIASLLALTTLDQSIELKCQIAVNHLLNRLNPTKHEFLFDMKDEVSITPKIVIRKTLK
jgi:LacI family transcriptional regulator